MQNQKRNALIGLVILYGSASIFIIFILSFAGYDLGSSIRALLLIVFLIPPVGMSTVRLINKLMSEGEV